MSKGSRQRPYDKKKFEDNWDKIFGELKTALSNATHGPIDEPCTHLETCNQCHAETYKWRKAYEENQRLREALKKIDAWDEPYIYLPDAQEIIRVALLEGE